MGTPDLHCEFSDFATPVFVLKGLTRSRLVFFLSF